MIRRNIAGQFILLGPLLNTSGAAQTAGAAVTVLPDGAASAGVGTLTHVTDGVWKYEPTQAETDCNLLGLILTKSGAVSVPVTVVTTKFPTQQALTFASDEVLTTGTDAVAIDTPSARFTDSDGTQLTTVTVIQALTAVLVTILGDRSGVGTREITAALPGVAEASSTATRVSRSVIESTVVVPVAD